jgi:heme A synthase
VDIALAIHRQLATVLVLYYTFVGLWGLGLGVRNSGPTPAYRGSIAIAIVAAVAQGVLGLLTFVFVRQPSESLHILYGFALVLALPLASSLLRDRTPRGQSVALGFAALFAAGLAIRGITTA